MNIPKSTLRNWRTYRAALDYEALVMFDTRLGILCQAKEPDLAQVSIAMQEVQEFEARKVSK